MLKAKSNTRETAGNESFCSICQSTHKGKLPAYCEKSIITSSWQGHISVLLINHFQEEDYQKAILLSTTARQRGLPCSLQGGCLRFPSHEFPLRANFNPCQKSATQLFTCSSDKRLVSHNTLSCNKVSQNHSSLVEVTEASHPKQ